MYKKKSNYHQYNHFATVFFAGNNSNMQQLNILFKKHKSDIAIAYHAFTQFLQLLNGIELIFLNKI